MKNFFNRLMYGKSNKQDLTKQDIEGKTRVQLFFEILGVKYMELIKLNLILIVYLIPTIVWTYVNFAFITQEGITAAEIWSYRIWYFAGLVPCLLIAAPAIAGVAYVIRNFTQDRHSWLWSDFRQRAKENRKQALLYMLIFTLFMMFSQIVLMGYDMIGTDSLLFVFARALAIVTFIFVCLSSMYVYPMMVTYDLKLKDIIRNSLFLTIGKLLGTIIVALLAITPAILLLILSTLHGIFLIVLMAYLLLIGITLGMYIVITYTTDTFETVMTTDENENKEENSDAEE